MKPLPSLVLLVALVVSPGLGAQAPDDRGFDPTGVWYGMQGPLALVRAGDTLTFSYSAVFGATAHMCDGIGVAGFVGGGRWEYVDEQGTVTFTTKGGGVRMEATKGIASFCGANWPGGTFGKDVWKPAFQCTVVVPKARFLTAAASPEPRKAYVVKGNVVEAVGLVNEGTPGWLLVRYVGKKQTTAGLLERDALECREE
jgi:hypothetical protein